MNTMIRLMLGVVLFAATLARAADLGAPDFLPTAERPIGWRGDGTGTYPGAHPPLTWSRRVSNSAVTNAAYQAKKPTDAPPAADAQPLQLGIIKDWLVLGPFATDDPVKDIEKAFVPDEAAAKPNENDKVGELAWKMLHSSIDTQSTHYTNEGTCDDYNVDFVFLYGQIKNQVAYAHTYIYSPTGGPANLALRHFSTAAKIWFNGKPTLLNPKDYCDFHKANVTLNKGWNSLLVKLACAETYRKEGQNDWVSKWRFSAYLSPTLPATYDTQNIAWMTKLPAFGVSAPVVVGERIYLTCGTSTLLCMNKKDGHILWMTTATPCDAASEADKAAPGFDAALKLAAELEKTDQALVPELNAIQALHGVPQKAQDHIDMLCKQKAELERKLCDALRAVDRKKYVPLNSNEVSGTDATPITDGKQIYIAVGGGMKGPGAYVLAAYSLDGQRHWSYHEALGAEEHGNHVSPALMDGKLIFGAQSQILALDTQTGKLAWRFDAKTHGSCSFNFVPLKLNLTSLLLVPPCNILHATDGTIAASTKLQSIFGGLAVPLIDNNILYCEYGNNNPAFQAIQLSTPTAAPVPTWKLDKKAWRLDGSSDFSIASSLIVNGQHYCIDTMGALSVVDLAGQKMLYKQRVEMFQRANRGIYGFTASPTLGGKNIYIFDDTGCGVVLQPGPAYKELAKNIIEDFVPTEWWEYKQELFYTNPVFDDASLYLKGKEYLYCISEKAAK